MQDKRQIPRSSLAGPSERRPGAVRCALALSLSILGGPSQGGAPAPADGSADPRGGLESSPVGQVSVAYVTNRNVLESGPEGALYGGNRGTPRLGRCEVQFVPLPLIGDLAGNVPFYVPAETKRVRAFEEHSTETFWGGLGRAAQGSASGPVVLFVHGYSNGFERGCRMAAEVQRALEGRRTTPH